MKKTDNSRAQNATEDDARRRMAVSALPTTPNVALDATDVDDGDAAVPPSSVPPAAETGWDGAGDDSFGAERSSTLDDDD